MHAKVHMQRMQGSCISPAATAAVALAAAAAAAVYSQCRSSLKR
jgi:hypothetical protein